MLTPIKRIRKNYNPIIEKIRKIINDLYDEPKYREYSYMRSDEVVTGRSSIEYVKYQGWDDGDTNPEKAKAFQEFKKDLMDRIQDQLSDDLKKYKIKIVEDDDFCLFVKEKYSYE